MKRANTEPGLTVRIAQSFYDELVAEQAKYPRPKRPTIGSLLRAAWEGRKKPPEKAPEPDSSIIPFPSGLTDGDIWQLHQLANILRTRPQGDVFRILENTLHHAITAYVSLTGSAARQPEPVINGRTKSEWLRIAAEVLESDDPDLIAALTSNIRQFGKDAGALQPAKPDPARPLPRSGAG